MDISFIVPCYNEVENVPLLRQELIPVLSKLTNQNSIEVIFIDDGSSDGTYDSLINVFHDGDADNISYKFKKHSGNWGLGKALKTGFNAAEGEIIVTLDSDGTYRYETIPALLDYLENEVDIVTASPYHPHGSVHKVPQYRLILSRGSSLIYRILVNWKIHTYTCLFRAYRRKVIKDVDFTSHGFLGGTELLVKSILEGYKVQEFPTVLYSRSYGTSKAKIARTIFAHLRFQFNILLHRLGMITLVKKIQPDTRRP